MHEFNFDTHGWSVISEASNGKGDIPSGRSSLIAEVHGHSLFLFGGYNGHVVLNDFYEYRFEPVSIPPPTLLSDLRMLINNKELSDVSFLVEGKEVHASRVHLAARSEHFRAMLFGGMRESASGDAIELPVCMCACMHACMYVCMCTVAERGLFGVSVGTQTLFHVLFACLFCVRDSPAVLLQDVSYDVFMKMLEFLYTDRVGEISAHLAIPLLIASERCVTEMSCCSTVSVCFAALTASWMCALLWCHQVLA